MKLRFGIWCRANELYAERDRGTGATWLGQQKLRRNLYVD
jgi:hypothetical protein